MKIIDMIQGSEKWHKYRYKRIGGTSIKKIMGTSGASALVDDLVSAWLEPYEHEEGFTSDAMQRGIDLEPMARQDLSQSVGIHFEEVGAIQSDIPILMLSPDGISSCGKFACEIKCPSREVHQSYIRENKIPTAYFWQAMGYFAVNEKLEVLHFASYRPESMIPLWSKEIRRNDVIKFKKKQSVDAFATAIRVEAIHLQEMVVNELKRLQGEYFLQFGKQQNTFIKMVEVIQAGMIEVEAC
jgi:putative phage-type endonuclease